MPSGRGRAASRPEEPGGGGVSGRLARRWAQIGPSPYEWEQSGLDHIRGLMPDLPPYRAVALFTFTAFSGRVNECDLFIAVPGGLYLLELKGHPGRLTNRGGNWTFHHLGTDQRQRNLYLTNPLHPVEMKSRDLRSRLQRAAERRNLGAQIPRINAAVFLSAENLQSELDEGERLNIYGRNDRETGLLKIWDDLLRKPPVRQSDRLDESLTRHLPMLFGDIGVAAPQAHLRFGDDWKLAGKPLDQGPTWEDRLATREGLVEEAGRVRIYLTELEANEQARTSVWRAAEREYQVLQGLRHRGIAEARDLRHHDAGPAILFRHDPADLRLEQYLSAFGESLTLEARLGLVRQLAEALRYAHRRSLFHRALAARSVYVSARPDGSKPVLRIIDWQTAARDFSDSSSTRMRSLGRDSATEAHLETSAEPFLAPEFNAYHPDPAGLDVFGLGAVSYLVLTGEPPAASRGALQDRLDADRGLHPTAHVDGLGDQLDQLIFDATRYDADDRLPDAETFLERLAAIEAGGLLEEPQADAAAVHTDALEAKPGDWLDDQTCVKALLGTGGTGRALLVERIREGADGEPVVDPPHVLKVALNHTDAADRLRAEAQTLHKVQGGQIVRLLHEPRELAGHTVIDIQFAGDHSLARELRETGKLPYVRLKNFADDLLRALMVLEREEVMHRDIKPDNLGVFRVPRNDERELLLFDFSLAGNPRTDVTSGTSGYLDPFLGTRSRPRYDEQAERYAVAVTLHEMASGEKPLWGNGSSDPKALTDQVPNIAAELFNPSLREGLTAFFHRALHRDADRRFDSAREMADAWSRVFVDAERTTPPTTPVTVGLTELGRRQPTLSDQRDAAAAAAAVDTALDAAGLSPAALEVAHWLRANTVGELLGVPQYKINRARGAGTLAKRELNQRYKEWTRRLRQPVGVLPESGGAGRSVAGAGEAGVDGMGSVGASSGDGSAGAGVLGLGHGVGVDADADADTDAAAGAAAAERLTVDAMAADLIRAAEATVRRRSSKKVEALRVHLGLTEDGSVLWWPTQKETADALHVTQGAVNQYVLGMAAEWSAMPWMGVLRDDIAAVLESAGRVMAVRELASEVRARAGALTSDRRLALRYAMAVARAALEVERGEEEPRFKESRRGSDVFVAWESLPGAVPPAPARDELVDYAAQLGRAADDAVSADPLPGAAAVRKQLRAVPAPEGMTPLADTRLVALAAAASRKALASPRLDLYPRDLGLVRALRISQAAAGVGHEPGVSVPDLLERIRVRFPELDFGDVTHVQLGEALKRADYPLAYDVSRHVFRGPLRQPPPSTGLASRTATSGDGRHAAEGATARLAESVAVGGFRALTVHVRHLPGLAAAIADACSADGTVGGSAASSTSGVAGRSEGSLGAVVPVDVDAEFLDQFRELARQNGQDWSKVLRIDGRLVPGGSDVPRAFVGYVEEVVKRLATDWVARVRGDAPRDDLVQLSGTSQRSDAEGGRASARDRHRILFLHNASLLARYWEFGGRDLLTALQKSARRPSEDPYGLWLLCPAENPQATPQLDGRLVETYAPDGEWIALTSAAVDQVRRQAESGKADGNGAGVGAEAAQGDAAQSDAVLSDEDRSER
ncbi:BREX system serine/threonine kinase PglW [Actinocrinis sp.]|uniref:BREX system serine/threonine kinase PglW n=1 Tax=Actinocrinis sp. TaxID=1920516 RepID=UPI002C42DDB3|nr:BREX system serine/threonine kinase PglW [Actinocrinis sp.]HXR74121.1 BREX system serine/threonine kinase PglW [Actinocrinis sp.]